jgi:diketogulonate reductase-like aldo/keto reductase
VQSRRCCARKDPLDPGRTLAVAAAGTLLVLVAFTTPLTTLASTAAGLGAGPGAQAWVLALKPWIVPIPGTTKLNRLEENLGAVDVELTTDDLREIEGAASKITVQGARYPESSQRIIDR